MSNSLLWELINATWETIYMVLLSGAFAGLFGLPLGIALYTTRPAAILQNALINRVLGAIVNVTRSIPFVILMVAIIPLTRLLVGSSIGTTAAIVPLAVAAIPFVARLCENALATVSSGLIEAGIALGATPKQIICKILLPEALPKIIDALTITLITLVGYSAMAGAVGGGGLGDLAIRYGYQRFDITIMLITIAVLVVMVQLIQFFGNWLAHVFTHD